MGVSFSVGLKQRLELLKMEQGKSSHYSNRLGPWLVYEDLSVGSDEYVSWFSSLGLGKGWR